MTSSVPGAEQASAQRDYACSMPKLGPIGAKTAQVEFASSQAFSGF